MRHTRPAKRWSHLVFAGAALLGALAPWQPVPALVAAEQAPGLDSLILFHTNDTHARLMPFANENGAQVGGAAARAALLERERAHASHSLLLDAGDVFQGTPYYNFFRGVPDYLAMAMMAYDAGALGNHDLDDGPVAWNRARALGGWEVLSANVFAAADSSWARSGDEVPAASRRGARWIGGKRVPDAARLRYLARPYSIRRVGGWNVALFGLTTSDITHIVSVRPNGGVAVANPETVAEQLVPELRRQADLVICISHIGIVADRALAERVPGIDLIVGGHSHTRLDVPVLVRNSTPNGYHGTVIAQAGAWGEFVGRVALYMEGRRPIGYAGRLIPVRVSDGVDPNVVSLLRPYADSIGVSMSKPVFHLSAAVPSSGLRHGETPLGNFVADAMRGATDADIAIINSGGIRAALPEGDVTVGDVYMTLPFDNHLVVVPMPGWQVRSLLDFAGRRIGKGGFCQVSGVSFTIRGDRAGNVRVGGKLIDSDRIYRVVTVDYLFDGGDGYTLFAEAAGAEETGILLHDAALRYLAAHPDYKFRKEGRIIWEGSMRGF